MSLASEALESVGKAVARVESCAKGIGRKGRRGEAATSLLYRLRDLLRDVKELFSLAECLAADYGKCISDGGRVYRTGCGAWELVVDERAGLYSVVRMRPVGDVSYRSKDGSLTVACRDGRLTIVGSTLELSGRGFAVRVTYTDPDDFVDKYHDVLALLKRVQPFVENARQTLSACVKEKRLAC